MKRALFDALMARSGGGCEWAENGVRCRRNDIEFHHNPPKGMGGRPKKKYDRPEDWVVLCVKHHRYNRGGHIGTIKTRPSNENVGGRP